MIIAVDTETDGLDATKFIMGCVVSDENEKVFDNKEDMWKYILELGYACAKKREVLYVYAHNHHYDFIAYGKLDDPNVTIYCTEPFILSYRMKVWKKDKLVEKEVIKFLDTYSLFSMSLKDLGKLIGLEKMEMPNEFKDGNISQLDKDKAIEYMVNDARIVLKSIEYLRKKIDEDGVKIKRLYTVSQVAIQYMINKLIKIENSDYLFFTNKDKGVEQDRGIIWKDAYAKKIHEAYRGGKVYCYKLGKYSNVNAIDVNSLYPYVATQMRFPDMRTGKRLMMNMDVFVNMGYIDKIGISNVLIYNKSDEYGLLSVRTETFNYYPDPGKYMIGTWTNYEIKKALENGYELIDLAWTIVYDDAPNPLIPIMKELYEKRKNSNGFDYYFYKQMMNFAIGKFAQHKLQVEYRYDDVVKAEEYIQMNYRIIKNIDFVNLYKRNTTNKDKTKKYYCPIIPTLINAYARVYMYEMSKKIPKEDLLYTDTDSLVFLGDHLGKFNIGREMGEFKVMYRNEDAIIWGNKGYSIGNSIKASGISKIDMNMESFKNGQLIQRRMVGILHGTKDRKCGTFTQEVRDFVKQMRDHIETMKLMAKEKIYIDAMPISITNGQFGLDANNVRYYKEAIQGITAKEFGE